MDAEDDFEVEHRFIGRHDFLHQLQSVWGHYKIFGIFGMRSVGKSRTVRKFIQSLTSQCKSPDRLTCVDIDLKYVCSEERLCSQLGMAFDIVQQDLDISSLLLEIQYKINKRKMSYILNVDNAEDSIESPAKVLLEEVCRSLTKKSLYLRIILTSTVKIHISGSYYWTELPPMDDIDSVALLRSVTPGIDYGDSTIEKISHRCLGLPLAILMTGAELMQKDLLPEDMLVILDKCRLEALSRTDFYAESESVGPVYANYIERLSEVFRQRLTILGYIPGSFTARHAQKMLGDHETNETPHTVTVETLQPLRRRHMLEWDFQHHRYNIHAILRDTLSAYYTIKDLDEVRRRYCVTFCEVMVDLAMRLSSGDHSDTISDISQEHPNIQKLLSDVEHSSQETYPLYIHMVTASSTLIEQYFGGESFQFYEKCLELSKLYQKNYDVAIVSGAYGRVLTNVKSEFCEGVKLYRQALDYVDGNTDQTEAMELGAQIHQNMGWNLHKQGHNKTAVGHLQKALDYQTKLGWKYHVVALSTLASLGVVNTFMGNFEQGEYWHLLCLKRRIEKYGENHPHVGSCYNNIGIMYDQKRDSETAAKYYRRGLEVKKQSNALPNAIVLSLNNVALTETRLGNFQQALKHLHDAMDLLNEMPGMYSYEEALTLDNMGQVYLQTVDYQKAVATFTKAVDIRGNKMSNDVVFVETLIHLGKAHKGCGNHSKALSVFRKALSLKERAALQMPQNEFIFNCLSEMIDMIGEGRGGNSGKTRVISPSFTSHVCKESEGSQLERDNNEASKISYQMLNNSDILSDIFDDARAELVRIIEHFRGEGLYNTAHVYDDRLRKLEAKRKLFELKV